MKDIITNTLAIICIIFAAIYIAPLIIAAIAAGIVQIVIGIVCIVFFVKLILSNVKNNDKDIYR
jgi:hypothetical protein